MGAQGVKSIWQRLTNWIYAQALLRVALHRPPDYVVGGDEPYLYRWWIIPRNRFFNVYLHQFIRSDDDRALHDHPWVWCSWMLAGTYTEHRIAAGGIHVRRTYTAGAVRCALPSTAHRLEVERGCWTLFFTGPVVRDWGFHCPGGWRHWRVFTDEKDSGRVGRGCD